jgi:hypothetical protein
VETGESTQTHFPMFTFPPESCRRACNHSAEISTGKDRKRATQTAMHHLAMRGNRSRS